MKTVLTGTELEHVIRQSGERSIWVEVSAPLAAAMMGQRLVGPNGAFSLERVTVYRTDCGMLAGSPVFIEQELTSAPLCTCGREDCAYCRQ